MDITLENLDLPVLRKAVDDALHLDFMDLIEARRAALTLDILGPGAYASRLDAVVLAIQQCPEHGRFVLVEELVAPLLLAVYTATQTCDLGLHSGWSGR